MHSGSSYSAAAGVAIALAAGLCLMQPVRAAEHITLANGFDLECDHHVLVGDRVRIFPTAKAADYFELSSAAISTVEPVPDLPADTTPVHPQEQNQASQTIQMGQMGQTAQTVETRLTTADLRQLLTKAGSEHNVDEDLLASVVKAESGGNARAVSRAGARGLMQLMPGTARELGVADSFAPAENVRGGAAYLDALLTRYHDNIVLALAAYNAGPEAVDRYHRIPPYHETQVYVARVIHEFNRRVAARHAASGPANRGMGSE